ncbi:MAG: hypothetical protein IPP42_01270 [Saprospiraceae bacterium]|nr:hypothetical protein [Saprospiraceae bacterium]
MPDAAIFGKQRFYIKSKDLTSISIMQDLIDYSYTSLPKKLEGIVLDKITLSIIVYHYYLNDIGQVPELDTTNRLSVDDHLEQIRIGNIVKN